MLSNCLLTPGDEVMLIQNLRLKDSSVSVAGQVFITAMIMQRISACFLMSHDFENLDLYFTRLMLCHNQSKSNVKV